MEQYEGQDAEASDLRSRWIAMVSEYSTEPDQREALMKLDYVLIQMVMSSRNALQFIGQLELDESRFSGRDISDLEEPYNFIVDLLTERATRGRGRVARVIDSDRGNIDAGLIE